jgi:hypothetical protein
LFSGERSASSDSAKIREYLSAGGDRVLDRLSLSVAASRMQGDLHIDTAHRGWITGAFILSYALFTRLDSSVQIFSE